MLIFGYVLFLAAPGRILHLHRPELGDAVQAADGPDLPRIVEEVWNALLRGIVSLMHIGKQPQYYQELREVGSSLKALPPGSLFVHASRAGRCFCNRAYKQWWGFFCGTEQLPCKMAIIQRLNFVHACATWALSSLPVLLKFFVLCQHIII